MNNIRNPDGRLVRAAFLSAGGLIASLTESGSQQAIWSLYMKPQDVEGGYYVPGKIEKSDLVNGVLSVEQRRLGPMRLGRRGQRSGPLRCRGDCARGPACGRGGRAENGPRRCRGALVLITLLRF